MSHTARGAEGGLPPDAAHHYDAPPANTKLLVLAGVLVAIPVLALMLVGTYAKKEPTLGGVPFFYWYQLLWVFLCSGFVYAAHRVVLIARPHRPMTKDGSAFTDDPADASGNSGSTDRTEGGR